MPNPRDHDLTSPATSIDGAFRRDSAPLSATWRALYFKPGWNQLQIREVSFRPLAVLGGLSRDRLLFGVEWSGAARRMPSPGRRRAGSPVNGGLWRRRSIGAKFSIHSGCDAVRFVAIVRRATAPENLPTELVAQLISDDRMQAFGMGGALIPWIGTLIEATNRLLVRQECAPRGIGTNDVDCRRCLHEWAGVDSSIDCACIGYSRI